MRSKFHRRQAAFTALEAALVIIIAGLVGAGSWYIYHAKHQKIAAGTTIPSSHQSSAVTPSANANPNSPGGPHCEPSIASTEGAVHYAATTYCAYVKTVISRQTGEPAVEIAGLKSIQSYLTPSLYSQLVASYQTASDNGHMNDDIVCAYGQAGYFDFPIKASEESSDGKTAVISIITPRDTYNGKDNYDYNQPPALYSVDLTTMRVSAIDCSHIKSPS